MKKILLSLFMLVLFIACGKNGSVENASTSNSSEYAFTSGNCSDSVILDFNQAYNTCESYTQVIRGWVYCDSAISEFNSKYPNINCKVVKPNNYSSEPFTITPTFISEIYY